MAAALPEGAAAWRAEDAHPLGARRLPRFRRCALWKAACCPAWTKMQQLTGAPAGPGQLYQFPRSTTVVNVLRVAVCPRNPDCDNLCPPARRETATIWRASRRDISGHAQRRRALALFVSPRDRREALPRTRVHFFYLRAATRSPPGGAAVGAGG
jgi:hypothetical protein